MTDKDQQRLYKDLAKYFQIITPPEDYLEEGEYFSQVIRNMCPIEAKTLLDLGCGGGNDDFALKKNFKITGIDVSTEMLELAKKLNPEVKYEKGDMRFFKSQERFDAVTIFDSINYMVSKDDLAAAFNTAYEHLKPGGVLVTVAEQTKESFRQNMTMMSSHSSGNIDVTFIENYYDPDPNDTAYEGTFIFLIRDKGKLRIETDRHVCGLFHLDEWFTLLEETGFKINKLDFNVSDPEARKMPLLICLKPPD
ncbi:MAG: class I SAM-dependent methyltransferase [Candidatus Saganbacteria bacterium]|nr:class I SAM-dependent methyltransferase [Candidatus Saganbacteria bacterium]